MRWRERKNRGVRVGVHDGLNYSAVKFLLNKIAEQYNYPTLNG